MKLTSTGVCDLCHHKQPSLYCCSDSAFLCSDCDSHVHTANFLVARHIRFPLSSTKTTPPHNQMMIADWKTRDVLVNWCTRVLGVSSSNSSSVTELACRHAHEAAWWVRPYRVALAASLWLGLIFTNEDENININIVNRRIRIRILLKRLEETSGVPAKSILVAAASMLKGRRRKGHQHQRVEESSAEC